MTNIKVILLALSSLTIISHHNNNSDTLQKKYSDSCL
jgi:hypothetical protein